MYVRNILKAIILLIEDLELKISSHLPTVSIEFSTNRTYDGFDPTEKKTGQRDITILLIGRNVKQPITRF